MNSKIKSLFIQTSILIALYVLLGNARSIEINPFMPSAVIKVNMIVPIIAGILFGWRVGLLTGGFGTLLNALITGSPFEFLSIFSHALIGFLPGLFRKKVPPYFLAWFLILGNAINITLFFVYGLMPKIRPNYWYGIAYELFIGILSIIVITTLFKLVFRKEKPKKIFHRPEIKELSTNPKIWIIISAIIILLTLIFIILFYFKSIFVVFIIGLTLIIFVDNIMSNFYRRIKKYKYPRWKVKIVGYFIVFFWLFTIYFLISGSINQLGEVVNTDVKQTTLGYYNNIEPYIPTILGEKIFDMNTIRQIENYVFSAFSAFLSLFTNVLINSILIIPLLFYMFFKQGIIIEQRLNALLPKKFQNGAKRSSDEIKLQLRDFLTAKVTESVVIGGICCLGFFIAGLKGWLFLGFLAGILNIIPFLGPLLGAIPPILIALVDQPIVAVYVIITIVIAQLLDNLYLIPFMISGRVKMDALLGIVLILVGAQLAGPLGMILALPIYLVYKITLQETYIELSRIYK